MDWRMKASLQKMLSVSRIGDKLNHIPVTINKNYHQNVVQYQLHECLRKYNHTKLDLNKKCNALEIGTGYSMLSPIIMFLLGFEKIITVDIDKDVNFKTFKKQVNFLNDTSYIDQISQNGINSQQDIKEKLVKIMRFQNLSDTLSFCHISYIAPYHLEDLEKIENNFDYICSQVVFEHIQPEFLERLFKKNKEWLNKDCISVHTVNFIDHFANPGSFRIKKYLNLIF